MKLLPSKKNIDKAKAQERKLQIDTGLNLAKSVDNLRSQLLIEKQNLLNFRETSLKQTQVEIDALLEDKANLLKWNTEARKIREELLKPLDEEWAEINKVKAQQIQEKQNIFLLREQQKEEKAEIDKEKEEIKKIATKIGEQHNETEKAKDETISLKDMAQREYEIAREERRQQTSTFEKALSEVHQRKEEYEIGLKTIEIRQNEVKEKENQILLDRKHLESQQALLRKQIEITKQNAS